MHVQKCSTYAKQNVVIRLSVKYLLDVNNSEIIRFSFSPLILNKLLRKPFLVRNLYFTCSGTVFITFLQEQLDRKVAVQVWFCKVALGNRKKFCQ